MEIRKDVSLVPYNTFGLDHKAKYFVMIHSEEELLNVLNDSRFKNEKVLILGGGSNLLFTADFEGIVIKNEIKGREIVNENDYELTMKIGAGENWHDLVMFCVENDWGGIENLSLIPGTVGAAPMQNIGAYGVEIKDVFDQLEALEITSGKIKKFDREICQFGYRESIFKTSHKDQYIITRVQLKLSKNHNLNVSYGAIAETLRGMNVTSPSIQDVSKAVIQIRQSKLPDPQQIGNAGSFFKNPVINKEKFELLTSKYPEMPYYKLVDGTYKLPAAWLIDQNGWKGKTIGNIGVHKHQALVLVNYGQGEGKEIQKLAIEIQKSVENKFGIKLSAEVNIL